MTHVERLMSQVHDLMDIVDKDMAVYEMTGVMDIDAQNAALVAIGPLLDQIRAETRP